MAAETRGPVGQVMVVGAGIAGVQAALDLANSGFYVHLVEKKSAIGGVMAQLDKTFPTNDCSMCIISPKLVECGRHLNIEIHTLSEVKSIAGEPGQSSRSRVEKEPRYIDPSKCTGCGACAEVCPVRVPDEFNLGLAEGKAVYRLYPQAIPATFAIKKVGPGPLRPGLPGQSQRPGLRAAHQGAQVSRGPGPDHGSAAPARAPSAASVPTPARPTAAARKWMSPSPSAT